MPSTDPARKKFVEKIKIEKLFFKWEKVLFCANI